MQVPGERRKEERGRAAGAVGAAAGGALLETGEWPGKG